MPANIRTKFTSPETRMIVLSDAENRTFVSSFILTKHRNVTDGRTDRNPLAITAVIKAGLRLSVIVSVYQCNGVSVCGHTDGRISWSIFNKIDRRKNPKSKTSSLG